MKKKELIYAEIASEAILKLIDMKELNGIKLRLFMSDNKVPYYEHLRMDMVKNNFMIINRDQYEIIYKLIKIPDMNWLIKFYTIVLEKVKGYNKKHYKLHNTTQKNKSLFTEEVRTPYLTYSDNAYKCLLEYTKLTRMNCGQFHEWLREKNVYYASSLVNNLRKYGYLQSEKIGTNVYLTLSKMPTLTWLQTYYNIAYEAYESYKKLYGVKNYMKPNILPVYVEEKIAELSKEPAKEKMIETQQIKPIEKTPLYKYTADELYRELKSRGYIGEMKKVTENILK